MVKELEEKNHLMEKGKILRELHDGIGGIATNISLLAELALKAKTLEEAKKMLATIQDLSREELYEIRHYMRSLDAREMTWQQLSAELRSQGSAVIEPLGISFGITSTVDGAPGNPGSLLWLNLFRIYKESLTNVIKHAQARSVQVDLHISHERLVLAVSDDGLGGRSDPGSGRGMHNMKVRAEELGGSLTVSSGAGMTVSLAVPLPVRFAAQTPG
jgi:signal transduction histidine kinase